MKLRLFKIVYPTITTYTNLNLIKYYSFKILRTFKSLRFEHVTLLNYLQKRSVIVWYICIIMYFSVFLSWNIQVQACNHSHVCFDDTLYVSLPFLYLKFDNVHKNKVWIFLLFISRYFEQTNTLSLLPMAPTILDIIFACADFVGLYVTKDGSIKSIIFIL